MNGRQVFRLKVSLKATGTKDVTICDKREYTYNKSMDLRRQHCGHSLLLSSPF